jgi:hypothetical protein
MSITKTKKISIGETSYNLVDIVHYYALTIDIVLPELREYHSMIFDLHSAYKDEGELEEYLFTNCANIANTINASDGTRKDIGDTKILFEYFRAYPIVRKYLSERKTRMKDLDAAFAAIEQALEKANKKGTIDKNVLAFFKKVKNKHASWTPSEFERIRDYLCAQML